MALTVTPRSRISRTICSGSKLASITTASFVSSSSTRYELVPYLRSAVAVMRMLKMETSAGFAGHRVHVLHAFELLHQARELRQGIDLDSRRHDGRLVVVHVHLEGLHVDPVLGYDCGDV